ncbi:galectin-3b [Gymnodraco acuticeps]|uniref:Galectin n=1 Tax=Gymnodraco acuticeps TaxID=8218 RepID=A0A6P8TXI6_GYMAC|nr:galectin-3b [Gymnodraco acuticeps]
MNLEDALGGWPSGGGNNPPTNPSWPAAGGGGAGGAWPGGPAPAAGGGAWPAGPAPAAGGGAWPAGPAAGGGGWPAGPAPAAGGGAWPAGPAPAAGGGAWPAGPAPAAGGGAWPAGPAPAAGGGAWSAGPAPAAGGGAWPGPQPGGQPGGGGAWPGPQPGGQMPSQPNQPGWPSPSPGPGPGPGYAPQQSLTVPYSMALPGGVYDKMLITIAGTIKSNAEKFVVNLKTPTDLAFHFNPRFNDYGKKLIVRNSCINKTWGKEERDLQNFPFQQGKPFEMKIMCTDKEFKVAVNNSHVLTYHHRVSNLRSINELKIDCDLTLSKVNVETMP